MSLPVGTVTFLFTDIEGSTRLWEQYPDAMRIALAQHDALLREAITSNHGVVIKTMGDGFHAAFATAPDAVNAALQAQIQLNHRGTEAQFSGQWSVVSGQKDQIEAREEEGSGGAIENRKSKIENRADSSLFPLPSSLPSFPFSLKVRMALNTGYATQRDGDYYGSPVNRVARLLATGHGGQILLSLPTVDLVQGDLPERATLHDLGEIRLRDLERPEHVYQLLHPDLAAAFPALKSLDYLPTNLPQQVSSFVGREHEMERVKHLLTQTRLLTLTGAGGCGKTRLALQVAAEVLEQYKDGVWLAELADVSDSLLVAQKVANVLGLREEIGRSFQSILEEYLQTRRLLLVLDNCEHLVTACAALAAALLRSCPHLQILATSREALNVAGEHSWRVPPLSQPTAEMLPRPDADLVGSLLHSDAVRLFVERAHEQRPDFILARHNASAVAQVCHRLDGIPLAIELAAARLKAMSVEQVATRLDNRFRLLTGGSRTALPRQQTLRALMDWSYDLLTEPERMLLRRLSIFAGGWTLDAAELVCTSKEEGGRGKDESSSIPPFSFILHPFDILDLLTSLVDKSLVMYEEDETGTGRYRLLETVRQYGREKLEEVREASEIGRRHAVYFLHFTQHNDAGAESVTGKAWTRKWEGEHDNLRAALEWCLETGEAEIGLQLGGELCRFWAWHGHIADGRRRLERLLQQDAPQSLKDQVLGKMIATGFYPGDEGQILSALEQMLHRQRAADDLIGMASTLNCLGYMAYRRGDYARACAYLEEAAAQQQDSSDAKALVWGRTLLGRIAAARGEDERAQALLRQSLQVFQAEADYEGVGWCALVLAEIAERRPDLSAAAELIAQSLAAFQMLDDETGMGWARLISGRVLKRQARYEQALEHLQASLELWRKLQNPPCIAWSLIEQADVARIRRDYAAARACLEESLRVWLSEEPRNVQEILYSLQRLAALAALRGPGQWAARLFGSTQALAEDRKLALMSVEDEVAYARAALGTEVFETLYTEGRALTLEQAINFAMEKADE